MTTDGFGTEVIPCEISKDFPAGAIANNKSYNGSVGPYLPLYILWRKGIAGGSDPQAVRERAAAISSLASIF